MSIQAKICGLADPEAVAAAVEGGASFLGFVFFSRSPRCIAPQTAHLLAKTVPDEIRKMAVVVNATNEELDKILEGFRPDYWQCHGEESSQRVKEIKASYSIPVVKAITVRAADDVAGALAYRDVADMLLFDARAPAAESYLPGGNGLSFDWNLLHGREFPLPWFLSGGLNADNVAKAVTITGTRMVDVSSSVESAPGRKDPALIGTFLHAVKAL